ncbi:hypothetical protein [Desulfobacter vibrioformis]|uniref:hypothetical protein n=1 Tax=Desulfobacter vibrioformis TaxID=34031 RepID=UPI000A04206E
MISSATVCIISKNFKWNPLPIISNSGKSLFIDNATVTICHSKTKNIEEIIRNADIVVAAMVKRMLCEKRRKRIRNGTCIFLYRS